jgi:hypothetical protein
MCDLTVQATSTQLQNRRRRLSKNIEPVDISDKPEHYIINTLSEIAAISKIIFNDESPAAKEKTKQIIDLIRTIKAPNTVEECEKANIDVTKLRLVRVLMLSTNWSGRNMILSLGSSFIKY